MKMSRKMRDVPEEECVGMRGCKEERQNDVENRKKDKRKKEKNE